MIFILTCASYNLARILCLTAEASITFIKHRLREYFRRKNTNRIIIGEHGHIVLVDKSVMCRSGIIRKLTSVDDNILDTLWIVSIVDSNDSNGVFVKTVANRKLDTMARVLEGGNCHRLHPLQ